MTTARETLTGLDHMRVTAGVAVADSVRWHCQWTVRRYDIEASRAAREAGILAPSDEDFARLGIDPYGVSEVDGNLLTTAGIGRIMSLLTGGGGQTVISTSARVGVGNGGGTAAAGDTDLSAAAGSANRWFQTSTVTTPSNVLTLAATFGTADGNFAWNEFGIDVGTPTVTSGNTVAALLLNHKTSIAQGTKASGQTWNATASVTLT
jgi:hypothetical protein